MKKGRLYLLPMTLGDSAVNDVIPNNILEHIIQFKHLVVENIKTTRRYLKKIDREVDIDSISFYELNKHTQPEQVNSFLNPCLDGHDVGMISEAGCPAVADPGSDLVSIAHKRGIRVTPYVGPNSILMALMGSGFNGQSFKFNGYLTRDKSKRKHEIRGLESDARKGTTQLFMETPFRNQQFLEDLLATLHPETMLCIAADITLEAEFIQTHPVHFWKKNIPNLHKRPCIFVLD
ncbi:SAM-dependent methyltransferase [Parvicella tangerina]|uniref:Ribosomal RNA small subunit methyltransferase I n=1 Tax=Parvicella tangerina TaxID=2829795 RepID=A0A916NAL6_9FLAO|nr:SAM-dependent methyltransferase [Parvicella tangerina]CAG5079431.1 Ribosomal RNA small subunit methyltransferase I [Parvicella tangerina]